VSTTQNWVNLYTNCNHANNRLAVKLIKLDQAVYCLIKHQA